MNVRIEPLKTWHDIINLEFITYLMMFQFHFYLSLFHVLYFSYLHILHCMWLRCIRSYIEDLNHGFLVNRYVHNRFIGLGNPLEVVVHHCLIGGMVGLGYWDGFLMVSVLVCMVTCYKDLQWVMTEDCQVVMTLPSCFIVLSLNLERILSLC